ncbi:MAG: ATP-binding cassette domain-containing protein [Oscillospiraceae bacterium]|nr:ATP-binding cassette domain-containing protein [Oscillospiraceae bacterium]
MFLALIEIRNLCKTFGTGSTAVHALEDVSLDIEAGEIFGIIGLSGAGKSTLVRCMNLLERPTSGTVTVDGADMTALSDKELRAARREIGMIFQSFNLLMQRNALANVRFPLELAGVPKKEANKRAQELLDMVGLGDRAEAFPAQLSGGQKQRVAIARALATNPKVLLCDEATSALDPTTTESILELLKNLNRQLGVTVVVITHEMRVVERICSRVAIIADSRIAEMGPVQDVFLNPQTEAAKKLVLPSRAGKLEGFSSDSENRAVDECRGRLIRLAFDGETTDRPIIADMILSCGAPVSIVYADTRSIEGRLYGHTVLQLPSDPAVAEKLRRWLSDEGVIFTEEE